MVTPRHLTLLLVLAAALGAPLRAQQPDSTADKRGTPFFRRQDAVLAGAFVVGAAGLSRFDSRLAHTLQDPDLQESAVMQNGANFFRFMGDPAPQIIGVGLLATGHLLHNRPVAALGLHGVEGVALGIALTGLIKGVVGRARPYVHVDTVPDDFGFFRGFTSSTDYKSFPSGHTTSAFAAAAVATAEVVHWTEVKGWGPVWPYLTGTTLFGGATLVGLSRMYHDKHWASDVVAGAAIGTFSGLKVVKYAYRHPANRLDRWLLPLSVAPGASGSVAVVWTISTGAAAAR